MQLFLRSSNLDAEKIGLRYNKDLLHLSLQKKKGAQRIAKSIEVK